MPVYSSQINVNDDYPTIKPSLNLICAKSKSLDPRVQFSRASAATCIGPTGYVEDVGTNQPRFDHDPVTGESLGILVENGRTNIWHNSDIKQGHSTSWQYGSWNNSTYTVSTGTQLLPDGSTGNCISIAKAASGGGAADWHQGSANSGYVNGKRYCVSIWGKGSGTIYLNGQGGIGSAASNAWQIIQTNSANGGTSTTFNLTSDWKRHWAILDTHASDSLGYIYFNSTGMAAGTTAYYWGGQVEEMSNRASSVFGGPSSFIRTVGANVTRQTDQLTIPQKELDTFFNWEEGTFVAEASRTKQGTIANAVLAMNNGGNGYADMYVLYEAYDNNGPVGRVYVGGTGTFGPTHTVASDFDTFNTVAFGYKTDDCASSVNGDTPKTDNSVVLPDKANITMMKIMRGYQDNTNVGRLKYLRYYPKKLSNAAIQLLSTN